LGEVHGNCLWAAGGRAALFRRAGGHGANAALAWQWNAETECSACIFGISAEKAAELLENEPDTEVRGFLGYAGWTGGQLEGELKHKAWVVAAIDSPDFSEVEGESLWKALLGRVKPDLLFRADAPMTHR